MFLSFSTIAGHFNPFTLAPIDEDVVRINFPFPYASAPIGDCFALNAAGRAL